MRVLLDECLPRRLAARLTGHSVQTVVELGWAGKKDRELLALAAGAFDAFVTADQNLSYQQNLSNAPLGVVVLVAHTNRLEDLLPLGPALISAIDRVQHGEVQHVGT